jgi:hypothetical protein
VSLLWPVLKKTFVYYWDEILYLFLFNLVIFVASLLCIFVVMAGWSNLPLIVFVPLPLLVWSVMPFLLFSLFWGANEIGEGRIVRVREMFHGGRILWKQALVWGGANVFMALVFVSNVVFYTRFDTVWSRYVTLGFLGLASVWVIIQLYALTIYPRLETPNFIEAQKNALGILIAQPFLTMCVIALAASLFIIGMIMPFFMATLIITYMGLLLNMTTEAVIRDIRNQQDIYAANKSAKE